MKFMGRMQPLTCFYFLFPILKSTVLLLSCCSFTKKERKKREIFKLTSTLFFASSSFSDSTFVGLMSLCGVVLSLKSQLFISSSLLLSHSSLVLKKDTNTHTEKRELPLPPFHWSFGLQLDSLPQLWLWLRWSAQLERHRNENYRTLRKNIHEKDHF